MWLVALSCVLLIGLATLLHYEVLGLLNFWLPKWSIRERAKLLAAIFGAVVAHGLEIALYGAGFYALASHADVGGFVRPAVVSLINCLYFSAETYSSLGFGDLAPVGPIRLLAGVEALNGLLLIGWSASFLYICMERFWPPPAASGGR